MGDATPILPTCDDLRQWTAQFDPDRFTIAVEHLSPDDIALGIAVRVGDTREAKRVAVVLSSKGAWRLGMSLLACADSVAFVEAMATAEQLGRIREERDASSGRTEVNRG